MASLNHSTDKNQFHTWLVKISGNTCRSWLWLVQEAISGSVTISFHMHFPTEAMWRQKSQNSK